MTRRLLFYHVSWWYYTLVIDLIGQLRRDVIGRLSVNNNSPIQDYVQLDDQTQPTFEKEI